MKRYMLLFMVYIWASMLSAQTSTQNYVRTRSMLNESGTQYIDGIQYFDGLGRPQQTVQKNISRNGTADLVTYQQYDSFGRASESWLPAAVVSNNGAYVSLSTLSSRSSETYSDSKAYSLPAYEASPLNRVVSQTGPGSDWHTSNKHVKTEYLSNTSSYVCRWYRANNSRTNAQVSITSGSVNYPASQLYVTKLTDEDGNISYEFKDKLGRVLLTRQMEGSIAHDTYYVYDSFNNLRAVLPPLAADAMTAAGTWQETHSTITAYAYLYKYDNRNRCIAKKLPGADWVYYVYDNADRVIFTQDGEMRDQGKWMFSIPDVFGRVVLTGTCTNSMTYTATPLGTNVVKATRSNSTNTYKGYTLAGVSLSSATVLSANYYDDYAFMGTNSIPAATDANFAYESLSGYGTRYTGGYKGLLTGTMTAQMNASGITASFLYSVMYYDERGRVIQTKSNNHLGGTEKEYIGYNFTGQPIKRRLEHSATGKATQYQVYDYTYDTAGRLTQVKHGLSTNSSIAIGATVIALNTYDDLGRLKTQKKGSLPVTTFNYNVRSWTKSIVNSTLFSQTLYYNEVYGGSTKRYNGNISAMSWKVGSETLRGYAFTYDGLSRLKSANYLLNGASNSNNTVSGLVYDKHGNIKNIQRRGKTTSSAYGVIDNLELTYSGNQLTGVTDGGATVTIPESNDFKKGSTASTQYTYNKNGAMNKDLNKNITSVSYNLLNLPAQVTFVSQPQSLVTTIGGVQFELSSGGKTLTSGGSTHTHTYTYAADGRKLKVVQDDMVRDYVGGIIYENGSLKRVLIDGGYVESGTYYYYLNDHLGNTRVVASGTGTVLQKNEYYPFGMPMAETANADQDKQPYKYNGKEFERKDGLNWMDYGARHYDASLGRFMTMDPMAEKYYSISPYAYCNNNPMRYVDPTGMFFGDSLIPTFERREYGSNLFQNIGTFLHNTAATITNAPIDLVNTLVSEAQFIGENGIGAYIGEGVNAVGDAVSNEVSYRMNTSLSQQASDLVTEIKDPQTWENVTATALLAAIPIKGATGTKTTKSLQTSTVVKESNDVFTVTPQGVVLPKGINIPKGYVENAKRPGSYGVIENGKFVEKLRVDPATKPGTKGPNNSHFHVDNKGKHETDLDKWPN